MAEEEHSLYQATVQLLGGPRVLHLRREIDSDVDVHDLVSRGIPGEAMMKFFKGLTTTPFEKVLKVMRISLRTFARRKTAPKKRLPPDESERLWRYAEIMALATRAFGSQEAAEEWLNQPALGLRWEKPIDWMKTEPGADYVETYLWRIRYGVYT